MKGIDSNNFGTHKVSTPQRDENLINVLIGLGWNVINIWSCEIQTVKGLNYSVNITITVLTERTVFRSGLMN